MAPKRSAAPSPPKSTTFGPPEPPLLSPLAQEALGSAILAFTVSTCVAQGAALAPLAIGTVLMVIVYAGGHVSGGHYNPAVTLAVTIRGKLNPIRMPRRALLGASAAIFCVGATPRRGRPRLVNV